jgi:GT2 family glycosyltransferase
MATAAGYRLSTQIDDFPPSSRQRARVTGKFLSVGEERLYLQGVTYGPFHPNQHGCLYHDHETVERDFTLMAVHGINAVRTYTAPPVWLLDAACKHGLRVMVGIPWEQHITFLDSSTRVNAIESRVREAVRALARHPAILCYTIGNEIPASIVRWHGRKKIERFLKHLYLASKEQDPEGLVTYVNFPSTEYLELDFLDFLSFNVYLEKQDRLQAYLARLQTLARNRPLVMAEVGLDSRRNGELRQAEVLAWQVRTVFSSGCSGVFVYAWTDEWSRGGFEIEDWDFGVTSRERLPKPALPAIEKAFQSVPFPLNLNWPRISVVICSYNGQRTIGQAISEVLQSSYPNYEVIVVNDGSTDQTSQIAGEFPKVRVISVQNGGLSAARNIGMEAATGEIIAYIDDDAYPDLYWLHYLGSAFMRTPHVAIGGPNIPPPGDGSVAECVANAPGGPVHVLLTDEIAEHIPGCNFAVRRAALKEIGGFDPVYRTAGDDVDACWRLQEFGTIGFAPAAVVWHHRRNSFKAYWKQQKGYGRAEALLERKWPLKYNAAGHLAWQGRVYGPGILRHVARRWRVYHGTWNSAPFQALYEPTPGLIQSLAQMPEWYLLVVMLGAVSTLGFLSAALLAFLPLFAAALALPLAQAQVSALRAEFPSRPGTPLAKLRLYALTALLYVIQPIARLWGRMAFGLTPWRKRRQWQFILPRTHIRNLWSEKWRAPEEWLERFESVVLRCAFARRGGEFDHWDLEIRGGLAGNARVCLAVEEHGAGKQLFRWRIRPVISYFVALVAILLLFVSIMAARAEGFIAALIGAGGVVAFASWIWRDCSLASGVALDALAELEDNSR